MTEFALMTTAEVAEYLRCTPRTLLNWRRKGRLDPIRVGRQWLYRRADIEQIYRGGSDAVRHEINDFVQNNDDGI